MAAVEDPRGFLEVYPPPVIFDDVQYTPDFLPYVKERIDVDRDRLGLYLLTGSQNLPLVEKISESLGLVGQQYCVC
jgi:predicted AAA+ superfamily ATPase